MKVLGAAPSGRERDALMNNLRMRFSLAVLAAAVLLLFSGAPWAQAQDDDNNQDPPTRAGRLGYVQGSVSFQPGGQGDWLDAVQNRPLTTGDNLWADKDSRAEVQIGSTSIRLGEETSVSFLDLGDEATQIRLSLGSLYFRVRHFDGNESFEVNTPNLAFDVNEPGVYRIDVNENGDSTIATVWSGEGQITGGGSSYRLTAGQQGTFTGTDQLSYDVAGIGQEDAFDIWARSRDDREDHIRSTQYVPADVTGYEDLDDYGRWHNEGSYGNVWSPTSVPYGWAPYRYGHWVYVTPWGWTWVEDEPWGFAPFHYGRWAFVGGGWCWVPGPVAVAPVYSPALVAFVGGGGFSIGVGVGVGWFPLGPGEVFVPWYRTSPRYVQNINITNTRVTNVQVTNVYNNVTVNHVNNITYVNQRVTNGVTVVNRDTFVNAQPVAQHIVRVDQRTIQSAPVTHQVVQSIQPQRQSIIGSARSVNAAPPRQVLTRPVVATRQPVMNRPAPPVAGFNRPAPAPPVRTVRAVAPTQAQPLAHGARGTTSGGANAPANAGRPAPGNNRGAVGQPGSPNRGATEANPRPAPNVPRPGAPENGGNANQPTNTGRPNAPENNSNAARPTGPGNNRPSREVPRPPSSRPEQPQSQPQTPANSGNARPESTRPETSRPTPNEARPENRPSAPGNQPTTPESRQPTAPENRPAPQETRPAPAENERQPSSKPETSRPPAPRPEAHPPQHESKPQPQRNENKGSSNDKSDKNDKNDKHFR